MKLLFEENLSRRLVRRLSDLFPESVHVSSEAMLEAPDEVVWQFARSNGYCLVTADSDFFELATSLGAPPKVIWLRGCAYPSAEAEPMIRNEAARIAAFLEDPDQALLVLWQK